MGLAAMLESELSIRNRLRDHGVLSQWPSPQMMGAPSVKAMILNIKALQVIAKWWVAESPHPAPIPIDRIRSEAWVF